MPQIRCPSCGTTINLENRKETDFSLILRALRSKARSFSELLKLTRLPRKTLNLRLKELCQMDAVTKDGLYYLNEACPHKEWQRKLMEVNSRMFANRRTIALLLILCVGLPITGNVVFAMFSRPPPSPPQLPPQSPPPVYEEPDPLGFFTVSINVNNVSDVYGWQVCLQFDSTNLKIVDILPGDFLTPKEYETLSEGPIYKDTLFYKTVIGNIAIICQTLLGSKTIGVGGSGTLVTVEFVYYHFYEEPSLLFGEGQGTMLLKIGASEIPINENTITMRVLP